MTREEMWKEFEKQLIRETRTPITVSYDVSEKMTKSAIERTVAKWKERLEQEPRWIPASERLPNTEDEVLCWYEYYHWSQEKILPEYGLGCYFKETKSWFGEVANGKDVRVIAWMPLPSAYKGGNHFT